MPKFGGKNRKTVIKHELGDHKKWTIRGAVAHYIESKVPQKRQAMSDPTQANIPSNVEMNHIAVVLDGVVEDVIRAQNRIAALFLSTPTFVEFDPNAVTVRSGETKYVDGEFINEIKFDVQED
jgi:hypothetical protein